MLYFGFGPFASLRSDTLQNVESVQARPAVVQHATELHFWNALSRSFQAHASVKAAFAHRESPLILCSSPSAARGR